MMAPLRSGPTLAPDAFEKIRREMILREQKWGPQVGDVCVLAPFPLLLEAGEWGWLARSAEALAREAACAEAAIACSPEIQRTLGVPRALRRVLAGGRPTPAAGRILRFDFHWTRDGWRISEVNSDVPGGYAEAGTFATRLAEHFPGWTAAGLPGERWAQAIARAAHPGPIALLAAPGYMEDAEVVFHLAAKLRSLGRASILVQPEQVDWRAGRGFHRGTAIGAFLRFYQGEWLAARAENRPLFTDGWTPVSNPGVAALLESKRFALAWDALPPLPTWRALLPECRDPREVAWRRSDEWVLKAAYSNTGDGVLIPGVSSEGARRSAAWDVALHPRAWVAQRRFEARPIETPVGPAYPCLGVYTVDGIAAGVYGRLAARPLVAYDARDVAVLVESAGERRRTA